MSTGYFFNMIKKKNLQNVTPWTHPRFLAREKNQQQPRDSSLEFIDAADDPELT